MAADTQPLVVFDLGGVLVSETTHVAEAARVLGVDQAAMTSAYWAHREPWDAGCSDLDYWRSVGHDLGVDVDEQLAAQLTARDAELWTTLRPEAERLVADVAQQGRRPWILSNAAASFAAVIDATRWRTYLAGLVVSGVEHCTKPSPEIYRIVEQRTGLSGRSLAFIDDREDNVEAALAQGWQAHLWRDDADSRAWLEQIGAL